MGFAINTNNDALNTYRNLTGVQNSLSKSLEKLSSGLRINQAGDDAAGLTISTQLASQVSGLQQASRNAQDGTSLVQTADGALTQAQSILNRMRDLAVQAGNDSNSPAARTAIQSEATSLTAELARIGSSVNFNGQNLLDGTTPTFKFQVGADGNSQSQIAVDLSSSNLVSIASKLNVGGSGTSLATTDVAGKTLVFTSTNNTTGAVNTSAKITVPASSTTTGYTDLQKTQDAVSALNGNSAFSANFSASVYSTTAAGVTTYSVAVTAKDGGAVTQTSAATPTGTQATLTGAAASNVGKLAFDSAESAQASIIAIDAQIAAVSTARANIGAIENRFNNVVSTISTSVTNLTAAKSRITDVDMAQEMVNYTRANVLSQAGTAMLAQANSLPQLALKLLG
ncbi:flagellin N-terminal helical domain-containing protein [Amnibacterium setariae]|uniref:Flagellin n=1 Tax=Amnibacterium setariae TaxID=2306585 RepID=A0A3A1UAB3_9MICO|nr:flagellin [Amnibacterium setariae]RIX30276.1 flagellin [Amnibacterium setariae]